jgi:hypothetical protein
VIESRADVFLSEEGAARDLAAYRTQFQNAGFGGSARLLAVPPIGDDAGAVTFVQPGLRPVRYFIVAWRHGNVTASIAVNGFEGRLALEDTVRLARKQQRRIAAAADAGT